ncbi:FtsX-like permease family protein [Kineococcus endophyticus]|uniref:FtsX-like permease family protein n=1 Tax=Kineococcus endophyticus TaxID=1181883 RepID=A0ABV3PCZ6_9ACTN
MKKKHDRSGHSLSIVDDVLDTLSSLAEKPARFILLIIVFSLGAGGAVAARGITESSAEQVAQSITSSSLDWATFRVTEAEADNGSALNPAASGRFPNVGVARLHSLPHVLSVGLSWTIPSDKVSVSQLAGSESASEVRVVGANGDWIRQSGVVSTPSNSPDLLDISNLTNVALVGVVAAKQLSVQGGGIGQQVWINGEQFTVAGLLVDGGDGGINNSIVISGSDADRISQNAGEQLLTIHTTPNAASVVSEAVPPTLDATNPGRYVADSVVDLSNLRRGVSSQMARTVAVLSLLLLFAASVTTANTMIMSVMTRTPEVALRRAMGLSKLRVARLFVLEGGLIGALGGCVGAALGIIGVVIGALVQDWTPVLSVSLVPLGVASGAIVGVLSALYPALRAARIDPSIAMRA